MKFLAAQGITRLMVEGGPALAAAFIAADLVDEAVLFHSPKSSAPTGSMRLTRRRMTALTERLKRRRQRAGRGRSARTFTSAGKSMFTGIISDLGEVIEVHEKAEGLRRLDHCLRL